MTEAAAVLGAAVVFVLVNAVDITTYPIVGEDEAMLSDAAKEVALHGHWRSSVFSGSHDFGSTYLFQPPGQTLLLIPVYAWFGFGIVQTRMPGVVLAALLLVVVYVIARSLGKRTAGGVALALLAFHPHLLDTARLGRMDTLCLFFLAAGLLAALRSLRSAERNIAWVTASGGLLGAAGISHAIAASYALAIGLAILVAAPQPAGRRIAMVLRLGICAAIPPAVWMAWGIVVHSWPTFQDQFILTAVNRGSGGMGIDERILAEVQRQIRVHRDVPLLLLLQLAGLIWLGFSASLPRSERRFLACLLIVTYGFNTFLMGKRSGFYFLYPNLASILVAALMIGDLWTRGGRVRSMIGACTLLAVLNGAVVSYAPRALAMLYQDDARDYGHVRADLRDVDLEGRWVWGEGAYWYAVNERGGKLQIGFLGYVRPDPGRHDLLIVRPSRLANVPPGFRVERSLGREIPAVLGRRFADSDYRAVLLGSEYRLTGTRTDRSSNHGTQRTAE